MNDRIKELNLLLLYLAGWEEDSTKEPGKKVYRSWKGYLFEVLNELQDDEMIYQFKNGKSVILLDEGIKKAEKLKEKYL